MAKKVNPPKPTLTTTENLIQEESSENKEGAENASSSSLDPAVVPTEGENKTPDELLSDFEQRMTDLGCTRMISLHDFALFSAGSRNYELHKGVEVWVYPENLQNMLRTKMVRSPKDGE